MATKVNALAVWGLVGITLCGCKSHPLGPYVSPRIEGDVVAAESGLPLSGVKVMRGKPAFDALAGVPKGGQLLMVKPPVETEAYGHFVLPSERVLSVFRGAGWNEIRLTFEKAGFLRFRTNLPAKLSTNTPAGEPLLNVGEVRMQATER